MNANVALLPGDVVMSDSEQHTDEQLMVALRQGGTEALAELVERYQNDVYRFCLYYVRNPEIAKELAQETFLRVYIGRLNFDERRKFKPWLLCIARNLCINELKRKKTVSIETLEEYATESRDTNGTLSLEGQHGPDHAVMEQERIQALMAAIDELPADARELIMLRYFEQMSAREISEILETTEGAVRTRLHRALKQLRDICIYYRDMF